MADFDDITGWREELAAFEETDEGKAFFAERKRLRRQKVPYENVVQLVELILADEELHEALRKQIWFIAYSEEHDLEPHDDEFWELNPIEANDTQILFKHWYLMKSQLHVKESDLIVAFWLAADLEKGELASLRNIEARKFIKEHYPLFVSLPGEEV